MATVSKTVGATTTTFVVTDAASSAMTMVVTTGAVTGNVTQFSGAAVHNDALQIIANLLLELRTGLIPGAGAQGLLP